MIFVPLYVILALKVYYGVRMIKRRFARPAFMTYYVTSWSFYGSFLIQMTMIWGISVSILKVWVSVIAIFCIAIFIPAWVLMNIHMRLIRD